MLMRLVEIGLKPGTLDEFKTIYRNKIISELEGTPGCLFAGLLQSINESNQLVSLTLWKSKEQVQVYIDSGAFQQNLDLATPFMEESAEWKVQLTKEDILNYEAVKQEPVIKSYPVTADTESVPEELPTGRKYLRVLSLKLMQGKEKEFKKIYLNKIQPALENVKGCRYSFLIDNSDENREMLSFTIWDDLQSVELYEQQGKFKSLLKKVRHTLSELYQWKMSLENTEGAVSVSSRDIEISKFTLVTGEKFK